VSISQETVESEATSPKHDRLGLQYAHVGEAVRSSECDRERHVQQDLARIVHRPRAPPGQSAPDIARAGAGAGSEGIFCFLTTRRTACFMKA
jgi:hypothetical protein